MEHEVKHALKVYKTAKDPKIPLWHKVREVAVEIVIIVFAVTLSIWLHDRSEHSHQQEDVKQFLSGLKQDLNNDIAEMKDDREAFVGAGKAFKYVCNPAPGFKLSKDSINHHINYIYNTTTFISNDGRYQGFKSSGKIGNIENTELQYAIINYYQRLIPSILLSSNEYLKRKEQLFEYLNKNEQFPNNPDHLVAVLSQNEAKNICSTLIYVDQTIQRYDAAVQQMQKIIALIDKSEKD